MQHIVSKGGRPLREEIAQSFAARLLDSVATSIMRPSLVDPAIGAVSGNLPGASGVKIYYLALDLSAGSLMTQLEMAGRPNGERRLELQLLDAESRPAEQAFVRSGFGPKDEVTRSFAIDTSGRYVIRVSVEGEENGRFCILFGGTALPTANAQHCSATTAAPVAARPTVAAPPAVPAPAPAPHPVVEPAAPALVAPAPAEPGPSSVASKLSTSMLRPTPVESLDGVILGNLPGGAAARTYYVSADVEAGALLSQLEISGRANGERRLTLELLGPDGRAVESAFVRSGFGTKDERTKAFMIDSAHRAVLRLIAEGEENGEFCLLVGGGALPSLMPHSCPTSAGPAASTIPDEYSTSILQPSAADSGLTAGKLPGGAAVKYYYLSADLTAGSLMTQLQIMGRPHGERRLTLELLGPDARVAESTFVRAGFGAKDESTKTFAIDASGRRLMRLIVEGDTPGNFCLLMGGTALPGGAAQDCPANTWTRTAGPEIIRRNKPEGFDAGKEFPGFPLPPIRLTAGYLLDKTGLEIIRTQIARPESNGVAWCAAIVPLEDRVEGQRRWMDVTRQPRFG